MNKKPTKPPAKAVILRFSATRGRPRSTRPSTDTGTPELVMKRLLGLTTEALDLCLERRLISEEQHWCGIHLRWLYTLRYGAPSVRAVDPSHFGGTEPKADDPTWRAAREKEFGEAIAYLTQAGTALQVMNLCVFNERPACLKSPRKTAGGPELLRITDGLELLVTLWRRKPRKS